MPLKNILPKIYYIVAYIVFLSDYDKYWIGLTIKVEYQWEDGTGKPDWMTLENDNKDCVYIEPDGDNDYEFKTKDCGNNRHYLCQMSFQTGEYNSVFVSVLTLIQFFFLVKIMKISGFTIHNKLPVFLFICWYE